MPPVAKQPIAFANMTRAISVLVFTVTGTTGHRPPQCGFCVPRLRAVVAWAGRLSGLGSRGLGGGGPNYTNTQLWGRRFAQSFARHTHSRSLPLPPPTPLLSLSRSAPLTCEMRDPILHTLPSGRTITRH
ncbi:unnamed protein product [Pleuronectes platessa]|uniref:Secreted protein n=1 Tax=Pleuronectes platessa TaxID=8262 RepID=A0A9N7Y5B2_PLEPL|nr:unnamed protein product [Pleuronectes platessa]